MAVIELLIFNGHSCKVIMGSGIRVRYVKTFAVSRAPPPFGAASLFLCGSLGVVMTISHYFNVLSTYENLSEQTGSILNFALIIVGSSALFRLSKIDLKQAPPDSERSPETDERQITAKWHLIVTLKKLSKFNGIFRISRTIYFNDCDENDAQITVFQIIFQVKYLKILVTDITPGSS